MEPLACCWVGQCWSNNSFRVGGIVRFVLGHVVRSLCLRQRYHWYTDGNHFFCPDLPRLGWRVIEAFNFFAVLRLVEVLTSALLLLLVSCIMVSNSWGGIAKVLLASIISSFCVLSWLYSAGVMFGLEDVGACVPSLSEYSDGGSLPKRSSSVCGERSGVVSIFGVLVTIFGISLYVIG